MINKLEMFIALAREKHFGRAAEALGITQPSLSSGIRQLEEQLGVRLVQRGSRFGGLTPEGQRTLDWARKIVGDTRRLREEMRASHAGLSGHLRIAVIPTALTWAARLTSRFAARHGNVTFTVVSRSSIEILSMLEDLEIDAGLTYLNNEPLGRVVSTPLYRERYTVVCRADHPLAGRDCVGWVDLLDQPLGLLTPDMQNRRIINRNLAAVGDPQPPVLETNSTIVLVSEVVEGRLATILPDDMARFLAPGHDLSIVPISDMNEAPLVGLIAADQAPFTPVLEALLGVADRLAEDD